ncbi:MAG TPA: hypothetical protein VFW78_04590 [Bacteroidia bacterium]|nr:hypothetical protein [Bacteroidia bacterium]
MKRILFFLLILVAGNKAFGQTHFTLIDTIKLAHEAHFTTDYLGNCYIYQNGDLFKYNKNGKQIGTYSTREFGNIGYIDASNPLKTLVVYPDFSKAVVLDASLSANTTISLNFPGLVPVNLICTSRDAGYWVYDEGAQRLKKLDNQYNVILEGTEMGQISADPVKPEFLLESGRWLFIGTSDNGILVFDRYGTYFKTIRLNDIKGIQVEDNEVIYLDNNIINALDVRSQVSRTFALPDVAEISQARLAPDRLFLVSADILKIYSF